VPFTTRCSVAMLLLVVGFFLGQGLSAGSTNEDENEKALTAALVRANDAAVTTGDWGLGSATFEVTRMAATISSCLA
jgi:hypothetical protein